MRDLFFVFAKCIIFFVGTEYVPIPRSGSRAINVYDIGDIWETNFAYVAIEREMLANLEKKFQTHGIYLCIYSV